MKQNWTDEMISEALTPIIRETGFMPSSGDVRQMAADLQAARKAMEEIGSCLIGAKEAFRDPDIQSAERYCNRALAALNAELEKGK